jgi:DNA polymerase III subunit alpha
MSRPLSYDRRDMTFVNFHSHSMYSLLDGYSTPEEIIIRAKEVGMPAIALTDHGTLSGSREFQAAAEKHGIQPILGCEMYISPTDRFDRRDRKKRDDGTSVYNHLVVVAKDQDGFQNLSRLSERAWAEGFYYKPRIDAELLEEHASGLLVFSGCLNGMIAKAIEAGNMDEAQRITEWFKNTFDEDFYMEIQPHNPIEINRGLLDLADMYNIKPVVTLDCHYSRPEERIIEELLLIISTKPDKRADMVFSDSRKMDMLERLNYLWPERQMTFEQLDLYIMSRASRAVTSSTTRWMCWARSRAMTTTQGSICCRSQRPTPTPNLSRWPSPGFASAASATMSTTHVCRWN